MNIRKDEHSHGQLQPERGFNLDPHSGSIHRDLDALMNDADKHADSALRRVRQTIAVSQPNDADNAQRFELARQELRAAVDRCLEAYSQLLNHKKND